MSERRAHPSSQAVTPSLPRRRALALGAFALGGLLEARWSSEEPADTKAPARPVIPADLRLFVERVIVGGNQSATVYADGVVVWNRERQLRISALEVASIAQHFSEAGFDAMPGTGFGAGKKRLRRRAIRRQAGLTKEVVQLLDGEQSPVLERLVDRVCAAVEPKPGAGVAADGLTDGLRKLAAGELAAETFSLVAFRKPELGRPGPADGWLLRVEEGTATASPFAAGHSAERRALALEPDRLGRLLQALLAAGVESLPGNLYAPDYRELTLSVLNRRKNLTARAFARMTPTQLGEQQTLFERAFAEIETLQQEVSRRGHAVAE